MRGHILSVHTPSATKDGSNGLKKILKVVMLHIKLKGMGHREQCKDIYFVLTLRWVQNVKTCLFFRKVVMMHIK